MLGKNKIYGFCLTMVVALELLLGGCGGADAEPASVPEIATAPVSEPAADTGNSVEAPLTDQDSLEFDDIPEIVGYEVTDQNPMGKERGTFFNGGGSRWKDELGPKWSDKIVEDHGEVMRLFGYLESNVVAMANE